VERGLIYWDFGSALPGFRVLQAGQKQCRRLPGATTQKAHP